VKMEGYMGGMFEGKVALVTGGASGIGRVGAQLFAREGARVVVATARNVTGCNDTVESIGRAGGEAIVVRCDVSKEDQVRAMVEQCVETYGRLDYAFNNAGVGPDGKRLMLYDIVDCPEEVWDQTLDTNLKGVFLCLKYEMRQMSIQGWGGAIVNCSSAAAVRVDTGFCAYNSSKHGLTGLTRTAALEGAPHKIRVNSVLPGPIQNTLLWTYLTGTTPGVSDKLVQDLPLGRIGFPEDVVEAVLWLCSDKTSFITGQSLCVDGGLTVH
jgi:NAD(P)-dependent dehydrogenase (short-subunit alcohol dehydrogenase family)